MCPSMDLCSQSAAVPRSTRLGNSEGTAREPEEKVSVKLEEKEHIVTP